MTLEEMHGKVAEVWPDASYRTFYRGDHLMHEWEPTGGKTRLTASGVSVAEYAWPEWLSNNLLAAVGKAERI